MSRFACLYQPPASDAPPDPARLLTVASGVSPRYELVGSNRVVIDITGLGRMFGRSRADLMRSAGSAPEAIGHALRQDAAARGLDAHVAIAGTRIAALVLAHARPGLTMVAPGGEARALAPLPIDTLAGIAPPDPLRDFIQIFTAWGLRTLGELAAIAPAELRARLGPQGPLWQAMARGEDKQPLVPALPEERFEASLDLEWPIEGLEPLSFILTRLLEPLSLQLERRDRGAAVLHVSLRLVSRETHVRSLQLPAPIRDARTLRTLMLLDLESHPPAAAVDRVTIVIDPTPGRVLQHTLFERAHPTPESLSTLLARLGALLGSDRLGAPAVVDTHRPGAFAMRPFRTDWSPPRIPVCSSTDVPDRRDVRSESVDERKTPPSISVSSSHEATFAKRHPDDPHRQLECKPGLARARSSGTSTSVLSALRRYRQPVPARVALQDGRPVRVTTDRAGFAGGGVRACVGPWRTSGEWWTSHETGELASPKRRRREGGCGGWVREEWDVGLSTGVVYRIFQDRNTGGWFIDAIAD